MKEQKKLNFFLLLSALDEAKKICRNSVIFCLFSLVFVSAKASEFETFHVRDFHFQKLKQRKKRKVKKERWRERKRTDKSKKFKTEEEIEFKLFLRMTNKENTMDWEKYNFGKEPNFLLRRSTNLNIY